MSEYREHHYRGIKTDGQHLVVRRSMKHLDKIPLAEAMNDLDAMKVGLNDPEIWVSWNAEGHGFDLGVKGTMKSED